MVLWLDAQGHAYGLQEEGTVSGGNQQDADPKAEEFSYDDSVRIEADDSNASNLTVNGHSLPGIRFLPDGTADETSPRALRLTAADGETLWLIQATNRLSYEIRNSDR